MVHPLIFKSVLGISLFTDFLILYLLTIKGDSTKFEPIKKGIVISFILTISILIAWDTLLEKNTFASLLFPTQEYLKIYVALFILTTIQLILIIGWYIKSETEFDYISWKWIEFLTLNSILWFLTPPILVIIDFYVEPYIYLPTGTIIALCIYAYLRGLPIKLDAGLPDYAGVVVKIFSILGSAVTVTQYLQNIINNVFYVSLFTVIFGIAILLILNFKEK